jgi:hypothetical protein
MLTLGSLEGKTMVQTTPKANSRMEKDLHLSIPEALFYELVRQAGESGVSLDSLCTSLLSGQKQEDSLIDPIFYESVALESLRSEIRRVIESDLAKEEVRKRVNALEFQISRRYKVR